MGSPAEQQVLLQSWAIELVGVLPLTSGKLLTHLLPTTQKSHVSLARSFYKGRVSAIHLEQYAEIQFSIDSEVLLAILLEKRSSGLLMSKRSAAAACVSSLASGSSSGKLQGIQITARGCLSSASRWQGWQSPHKLIVVINAHAHIHQAAFGLQLSNDLLKKSPGNVPVWPLRTARPSSCTTSSTGGTG